LFAAILSNGEALLPVATPPTGKSTPHIGFFNHSKNASAWLGDRAIQQQQDILWYSQAHKSQTMTDSPTILSHGRPA
jgi:hypothetical protein